MTLIIRGLGTADFGATFKRQAKDFNAVFGPLKVKSSLAPSDVSSWCGKHVYEIKTVLWEP